MSIPGPNLGRTGAGDSEIHLRVTVISPGIVATELGHDIPDQATKENLAVWRKAALTPDAIARAIAYAVEQPDDVDVNEIVVRPTTANL